MRAVNLMKPFPMPPTVISLCTVLTETFPAAAVLGRAPSMAKRYHTSPVEVAVEEAVDQ